MTTPATTLRELHRLRRQAKELQDEIERGPRLLKAHQTKVARQEEALRQGHEDLKKLKAKQHEKETDLKVSQDTIKKHEEHRNKATSKKEYDAAQSDIIKTRESCRKIEDQILEIMEQIERKTADLPILEQAVRQAKAELAQFEQGLQGRMAGLQEQLKQAQTDLTRVEAELPDDVRPQYLRLVNHRGEDALSMVQAKSCVACYTAITAQQYNELMQGQFVLCKSCGRILYLPE
jgi:hypothetical protein